LYLGTRQEKKFIGKNLLKHMTRQEKYYNVSVGGDGYKLHTFTTILSLYNQSMK